MRLRASLRPSPLSPSGTGKESFKISRIAAGGVIIQFYPADSRSEASVEIAMDQRTAWHLSGALDAIFAPRR